MSIQASATVTPVATGSHLLLTLSGAGPRQRCELVAIGKDGRQEVTASWMTTDAGQARVAGKHQPHIRGRSNASSSQQ